MFSSKLIIAVLVCVMALFVAGCSSSGGCGDCGTDCCGNLDANCCDWDFYKPCDLIEGKAQRDCRCGSSPCGIVVEETGPCSR